VAPRSCQSIAVAHLRFVSASPDDPLAEPLLSELAELEATVVARGYRWVYLITGNRQPEAEALYHAAGYTRVNEPLPSWGPFEPIAFAKGLR
jgi:hypothetical protein